MMICLDPTGTRVAHGDQQGVLSVCRKTPDQVIWCHCQPMAITSVAWSWDGAYLASGDEEGTIRLWEAQTGVLLSTARGHQGAVAHLAWSPTAYLLASSAGEETVLRLWDYAALLRATGEQAEAEKKGHSQ